MFKNLGCNQVATSLDIKNVKDVTLKINGKAMMNL